MKKQIEAGADIHAGDGGYSIGTKEKYDEFVKNRKMPVGNYTITELAIQTDIWCDQNIAKDVPWYNSAWERKYAELIVRQCISNMQNCGGDLDFAIWNTKEQFGIEKE